MPRDLKTSLQDIRVYIGKLLLRTSGRSLTDYESDEDYALVVDRLLTIIAEALNRAAKDASRISNLGWIVAFRNILIHD